MCLIADSRFINFYGQRVARLSSNQTLYGYQPTRTYLIKTLSILLFYTPDLYFKGTRGRRVLLLCTETC